MFGQDTIQITDDLKVAAGVRYDIYSMQDKPPLNPNFGIRNGFNNQKTIDGLSVVMPRVSVEWRATPNLKINGGFGLFSGGTPDVITGAPFYNTGYVTTSVDIRRVAPIGGVTQDTFIESNNAAGFTQAIGGTALGTAAVGLNKDPTFGYVVPTVVQQLQRGTLVAGAPPAISPVGAVIALDPSFQMPAQYKFFVSGQWTVFDGWQLGVDVVASQVQHDVTYTDLRAKPLIVNGVQQFLPDGRIRYNGFANGLAGVTANNVTGSNQDLLVKNTAKGKSYTAAFQISKSWDWGGDFSFGYAKQSMKDVSAGLFFGTTAGSLYNSVPAMNDPNVDNLGRSVYEIPNRYKLEFGFHRKFFGDYETRMSLFAERQDGRPYGFYSSDVAGGRGTVFGVTKFAQALYVPDFKADTNTSDLRVGMVTFATQPDLNNFKRYVENFSLPQGQLLDKYNKTNAAINRVDMSLSQELPTLVQGHKLRVQVDIRNLLNLVNPSWGRVAEYSDTTKLASMRCATAAGAAVAATDTSCVGYLYSNVPTSVQKNLNSDLSLWFAQISLRYEF